MTGEPRYAVLLATHALPDSGALCKALAPALGRPVIDLAVPMRRTFGLIALDADKESAQKQAEALTAAGMPALYVPASLVEELPPLEPLRNLDIPKPLVLVSAAVFTERVSTVKIEDQGPSAKERALGIGISLATGLPASVFGVGGTKRVEKRVESSDLAHYLEVLAGKPLRRFRGEARDFDYSCLGTRKGFDAAGNFRRLVETLAQPGVPLSCGAEGLLAGKPIRQLGYDSVADIEREQRWLLTLAALGK